MHTAYGMEWNGMGDLLKSRPQLRDAFGSQRRGWNWGEKAADLSLEGPACGSLTWILPFYCCNCIMFICAPKTGEKEKGGGDLACRSGGECLGGHVVGMWGGMRTLEVAGAEAMAASHSSQVTWAVTCVERRADEVFFPSSSHLAPLCGTWGLFSIWCMGHTKYPSSSGTGHQKHQPYTIFGNIGLRFQLAESLRA